jgi:hypothetical protein
MRPLRHALDTGRPEVIAGTSAELDVPLADEGPAVIRVWLQGQRVARVVGHGATLAAALDSAAHVLADWVEETQLATEARRQARIQVDLVVARGPMVASTWLGRVLGIHPGLEGLEVEAGDQSALLLADELCDERFFTAVRPLPFLPELQFGFDFTGADELLRRETGIDSAEYERRERRYFRLRSDSFVEPQEPNRARGDAPLPLTRGVPPRPVLTAAGLRSGATAGGRYLAARIAENGRFVYEEDLVSGRVSDPQSGPYHLTRHAGTTYFLAELLRRTGDNELREPLRAAIAHLAGLAGGVCAGANGGQAFACIVDAGPARAELGTTALAVVALVEYRRATGDVSYDQLASRLAAWLLLMQRPDGSFAHAYDADRGERDERTQSLYYSSEAALALVRMHAVYGDPRWMEAAERALDWLISWYHFFGGGFFFGEEHWTCQAAEAAWPALQHDRYRRFCRDYAAFLRRQAGVPGDFPDQSDLVGAHYFTPFLMPLNTPTGSHTEAAIAAYLLTRHHGDPDPDIRAQITATLDYLLAQQVREESDWNVRSARSHGAITASPVLREVRIDYVQHVGAAMLRGAELLEQEANSVPHTY